jgi:hypothetical protein
VSARLLDALGRISPAALLLIGAVLLGATLFEAWMLVLRQPFAAYREARAARESLSLIEKMTAAQEEELRRASTRAKALADRLNAELPAADEQLSVSLMRQLDRGAARGGIALTNLKPAGQRQVLSFEETTFEVGAQGRYLSLCQWLLDFERSLGKFATVSEFNMRSADEGRQVALTMRLALYRPRPNGGADK